MIVIDTGRYVMPITSDTAATVAAASYCMLYISADTYLPCVYRRRYTGTVARVRSPLGQIGVARQDLQDSCEMKL